VIGRFHTSARHSKVHILLLVGYKRITTCRRLLSGNVQCRSVHTRARIDWRLKKHRSITEDLQVQSVRSAKNLNPDYYICPGLTFSNDCTPSNSTHDFESPAAALYAAGEIIPWPCFAGIEFKILACTLGTTSGIHSLYSPISRSPEVLP